jgi:hypothetical protein
MSPMQILNQLYAGKKITLAFESEKARENFRQRIYRIKKGQDKAVTDVLDEEKLILRSEKIEAVSESGNFILKLWTEDKKPPTYSVLSIEEGDDTRQRDSESPP